MHYCSALYTRENTANKMPTLFTQTEYETTWACFLSVLGWRTDGIRWDTASQWIFHLWIQSAFSQNVVYQIITLHIMTAQVKRPSRRRPQNDPIPRPDGWAMGRLLSVLWGDINVRCTLFCFYTDTVCRKPIQGDTLDPIRGDGRMRVRQRRADCSVRAGNYPTTRLHPHDSHNLQTHEQTQTNVIY